MMSGNVRDFGATGDGVTDDTTAIQGALDAAAATRGTVIIPDGTFCCSRLRVPPHVGIVGNATWSYREGGGSVLKLIDPEATCLLDITGAVGATVNGLSLNGAQLGKEVHGIMMDEFIDKEEEDTPCIERCHISKFTGNGIHLDSVWCFSVRSCEVKSNGGHGLWMNGWDGFVLDNWFSGNHGVGYCAAGPKNASITMTGNRIEWNRQGGIVLLGGNHYNITGNYIDRSGCTGLSLLSCNGKPCSCVTITGNIIYRSGKPEWTEDESQSAHIRIEEGHGVVCTGNSMCVGQDDGGGTASPQYGMVLRALKNSIVKDNVLHIGALKQVLLDLGEHEEGAIIKDNVGSLFDTSEGESIWGSTQL
jgi:Pectate lyase superfamily protein/Right handed beta helix region